MKKFFFVLSIYTLGIFTFATEAYYEQLLEHCLENDAEYKTFNLEMEMASEELKKTRIASIANLDLGLSEGMFSFSKKEEQKGYSFTPYASVFLPIYNNLGFKFSSPISKMGEVKNEAYNFSLSAEIYGTTRKNQKLLISIATEKQKSVEQKLKRAKKYVEKKLLKELKELFTSYGDVLDKKLKEMQAEIALNQLRVQGYGEASSKMRTSNLSLLAAGRDVKESLFSLETKYNKFIKKTVGSEETPQNEDALMESVESLLENIFLSIPKDELLSLDKFSEQNYIAIEEAKRAYEVNVLKNKIALNPLTVSGEAGFSDSKKTFTSSTPFQRDPVKTESVSAGISLKMPGAKITTALDFPLDSNRRGDIGFKFGFALNPLEIWSYTIEKKKLLAGEKIEELKIGEQVEEFETFLNSLKTKRNYIEWQNTLIGEELPIYKENAQEHGLWFSRGLIGNSEKLQAEMEYSKAKLRQLDARISINSFNIETYLLFSLE